MGKAAIFGVDRHAPPPPAWLSHQDHLAGEGMKPCATDTSQTPLLQQGELAPFFPELFHAKAWQKARCQAGNWELLVKVAQCRRHAESLNLVLRLELGVSHSSLTSQSPPAPPLKSPGTSSLSPIQPHHTQSPHTWSWTTSFRNSKCQQRSRKTYAVCSGPAQAHMIASTFPPSLPVSQHPPGVGRPW